MSEVVKPYTPEELLQRRVEMVRESVNRAIASLKQVQLPLSAIALGELVDASWKARALQAEADRDNERSSVAAFLLSNACNDLVHPRRAASEDGQRYIERMAELVRNGAHAEEDWTPLLTWKERAEKAELRVREQQATLVANRVVRDLRDTENAERLDRAEKAEARVADLEAELEETGEAGREAMAQLVELEATAERLDAECAGYVAELKRHTDPVYDPDAVRALLAEIDRCNDWPHISAAAKRVRETEGK